MALAMLTVGIMVGLGGGSCGFGPKPADSGSLADSPQEASEPPNRRATMFNKASLFTLLPFFGGCRRGTVPEVPARPWSGQRPALGAYMTGWTMTGA
jgi:hypothetical protein